MTRYQMFLAAILVLWPVVIIGLLFLMNRMEAYVARTDAETPEEAGLEPVHSSADKEVRIIFGENVIGERDAPA